MRNKERSSISRQEEFAVGGGDNNKGVWHSMNYFEEWFLLLLFVVYWLVFVVNFFEKRKDYYI